MTRDGIPKHESLWMRDVDYYPDLIEEGWRAKLYVSGKDGFIKTSKVEFIQEDEINIVLTTKHSIYYIKKLREI